MQQQQSAGGMSGGLMGMVAQGARTTRGASSPPHAAATWSTS